MVTDLRKVFPRTHKSKLEKLIKDFSEEDINKIIAGDKELIEKARILIRGEKKINHGDQLKIAIWFINKMGSCEQAKKAVNAACAALEAFEKS